MAATEDVPLFTDEESDAITASNGAGFQEIVSPYPADLQRMWAFLEAHDGHDVRPSFAAPVWSTKTVGQT